MKKILNWIFTKLDGIGKDKYQHFTIGAVIAAVVFICLSLIGREDVAWWLSLMAVFFVELFKECFLDGEADIKDIIATMLGWAAVGAPLFLLIFL